MNKYEAKRWYQHAVEACRPMRERCKPLLRAIANVAINRWGDQYWEHEQARDMLRRELALMGITLEKEKA